MLFNYARHLGCLSFREFQSHELCLLRVCLGCSARGLFNPMVLPDRRTRFSIPYVFTGLFNGLDVRRAVVISDVGVQALVRSTDHRCVIADANSEYLAATRGPATYFCADR